MILRPQGRKCRRLRPSLAEAAAQMAGSGGEGRLNALIKRARMRRDFVPARRHVHRRVETAHEKRH
jgi:hypothetical protein